MTGKWAASLPAPGSRPPATHIAVALGALAVALRQEDQGVVYLTAVRVAAADVRAARTRLWRPGDAVRMADFDPAYTDRDLIRVAAVSVLKADAHLATAPTSSVLHLRYAEAALRTLGKRLRDGA